MHIPMEGLLAPDQPLPMCNCGFAGDLESVASLSGITATCSRTGSRGTPTTRWRRRVPTDAAKAVARFGERGDEMGLRIFGQQAMAIGRMFTIVAHFTDPDAYFVGGGVTDAAPHFRDWFLARVRRTTELLRRAGRS